MNVLNKLTVKSLRMNKKRTIATIIGIILSSALICALAGLVASIQETLIKRAIDDQGNFHAVFQKVEKENLKYVRENRNVKEYFCVEGLGYAPLPESQNPDKPYWYLMAFDESALENTRISLVEGRMPEKDTEVVITKSVETNGKVEVHVGDVLSLSVSKRESDDGYELFQNNPHQVLEDGTEIENLAEKYQKNYTVVGIIERPNYTIEPYSAPGYSAITKMREVNEWADIYVNFTKIRETEKNALNIKEVLGRYQEREVDIIYNRELLRWSGAMVREGTMELLYGVGALVLVIIMVSSVFVIRNSFAISVTERIRQYGMLASVGATKRQIRKNVFFEGFLLGMIAVPLGVFFGNLAVIILLFVVNHLLEDALQLTLIFSMPLPAVLLTVLLSALTIYFSAFSSAKKASKISPLEAIRSSREGKLTAKAVRMPKWIKRCFGVGGEIAYKNLKRSRKKYRATVISLVVSIVLFLSVYSFLQYSLLYGLSYYDEIKYNGVFNIYNMKNSDDNGEDALYHAYQKAAELDGVLSYSILRYHSGNYYADEDDLSDFGKRLMKDGQSNIPMKFISLGNEQFEAYKKQLGVKQEDENGAILLEIGYHYNQETESYSYGDVYDVKKGDSLTGTSEEGEKITVKIMEVTKERPMGMEERAYQDGGYCIVSDSFLESLGDYYVMGMFFLAEDPYALEDSITENKEWFGAFHFQNIEENKRQENAMVLIIKIFLYGFIAVITLIGVTNIFNTITTNISLREREFAMLRSVGMTQREFSGMIRLESIFYGMKALLIGIPIGTAISYLFYYMYDEQMEMGFSFPVKAYMIVILFVFCIVGLTMGYSFRKIKDKNMIESIRKDMF